MLRLEGPALNGKGSKAPPACFDWVYSIMPEMMFMGVLGGGELPEEWKSGDGDETKY